jgi:hypothetical protein
MTEKTAEVSALEPRFVQQARSGQRQLDDTPQSGRDLVGSREGSLTTFLPALALLVVPGLLWTSALGTGTNVGGDVPNLLFLQPLQFLDHLGLRLSGNGLAGYNQFVTYDSLAVLALVLKTLHLNPEVFVSGLTLALTYVGVQRLVLVAASDSTTKAAWRAACFAGAVAALAPMISEAFWTNYLPRLYLLALAPWLIVFAVRYIRSGKFRYAIAAAGTCAFCSIAIADVPGSLPIFVFCVIAVIILLRASLLTRIGMIRLVYFAAFVIGINAFWIVPFSVSFFEGQSQVVYASSQLASTQTIQLARALAPQQSLANVLSLQMSQSMMVANQWSQESLARWLGWLEAIGYLPVVCLVFGLIASAISPRTRNKGTTRGALLGFSVVSLIALGLVSLRLPGSLAAFDEMARIVPGWSAERNFYETFAIPYVLAVAVAGGLGLVAIAEAGLLRTARLTAYIGAALFVFYDAQLLTGQYFRLPYFTGSTSNRVVSSMPLDYDAVVGYIASHTNAPAVTLPLIVTDWSYLAGKDSTGASVTYIGISPLFYLSGIDDYDGVGSFQTSTNSNVMTNVEKDIAAGATPRLARVISALGVQWIVDEGIANPNGAFKDIVAADNVDQSLTETQDLVGELRARFITSSGLYTLLRVGSEVDIPYASIDRSTKFLRSRNGLNQVATGTYTGSLRSPCGVIQDGSADSENVVVLHAKVTGPLSKGHCSVVLRTGYSTSWRAVVRQGSHVYDVPVSLAYGFADGFTLPALQKGRLTIQFENNAQAKWKIGAGISSFTVVTVLGLGLWPLVVRRGKVDSAYQRTR